MNREFLGMFSYRFYKSGFIYLLLIDAYLKLIVDYPLKQKQIIKSLEDDGIEVIGYIRKPKRNEKEEVRVRLMETMADRLRERCLAHGED